MLLLTLMALLQAAPTEAPAPGEKVDDGVVEFTREPGIRVHHSIKVFAHEGGDRIRYLDEIGSGGGRRLTVEAPEGRARFVVIVQPSWSMQVSRGSPTFPERRRRPNVVVEVRPGHVTRVEVGGFTDFNRTPSQGDTNGLRHIRPSDTPEASQLEIQIRVGEPEEIPER